MRFQFVHAADLHIDSPLASLRGKDARVAEAFAAAGRKAVERLVDETLESGAKFLIIAGDVFDGDWRDVSTGLFFVRELGRLDRAGVPCFIIKGNHDAESVISRALPYPASTHVFGARGTQLLEPLRVALHGRSFADRQAPPDFLAAYPPRREGWLNIGILHTSLEGGGEHKSYAPCTVQDLARFGYDYWALGHIHTAQIVSRAPWIVYPGNIQGRNPRETGPKGAMRVTVQDGRILSVEPLALDAARWAHERVDVTGLEEDAIRSRLRGPLEAAVLTAQSRPLALRLTLTGPTPAHARLVAKLDEWQDEARALGLAVSADCWVERLRLETSAPVRSIANPGEIEALLAAAADDPAFAAEMAELAAQVADKLPRELREAFLTPAPSRVALARDLL